MPPRRTRLKLDPIAMRVGELLHYVWDPIGVQHYPQARDEYDSYVPQVVALLAQGKTTDEIATHLLRIENERMGEPITRRTRQRAATVARLLIDHHRWLAPAERRKD